ncbi:MAG TPA: hypothetical protein VNM91_06500 [Dehalococcoidia bacterium]|nr:hypothetical protein [Dehalococcoidia bacterium]
MAKRDPQRTEKLRKAVRYMLEHGTLAPGSQSRLAEHFNVSRQRVHQIVVEERRAMAAIDDEGNGDAGPAQHPARAS